MLLEEFELGAVAATFGVVCYGGVVGEGPVRRVGCEGGEVEGVSGGEARDRGAGGC